MTINTLTGYLLHQRDAGETSAQAVFFTRERGVVHARVQGARTRKKQALLQPFMPLWIVLDERPYGAYVKELEVTCYAGCLLGQSMLAGLYMNELLYRALHPNDVDVNLFEIYQHTLETLTRGCDRVPLEIALRCFELAFIESLGAQVSFVLEADGKKPILAPLAYRFVPQAGFFHDSSGFLGAHLLAMAGGHWLEDGVLKTAKRIMRIAIHDVLDGVVLQTRQLQV